MRNFVRSFLPAVTLASLFSILPSADSCGQPAQLRGKSILLWWSDSRAERVLSTDTVKHISQVNDIKLYVSTAGRVFSEFDRRSGRNSNVKLGFSGSSNQILNWKFEGSSIAAYQHFTRGARRIEINFDAGFTSCSVRVLNGKEGGTQPILTQNFQHTETKETVIEVTATKCTIRDGNVFGAEVLP
jgi:hypothetical protein